MNKKNQEKKDKPKVEKIHCKNCNLLFIPSRPNKLYCSTKCQARYYEKYKRKKSPKKYLKIQQKRKEEQLIRTNKGIYTFEEIGYIVMNYNLKTISEIAKDLNRTNQSVEHKIRLLKKNFILSSQSNMQG